MQPSEHSPEDLVEEALDVIALGYPYQATEQEKAAWMADMQALFENRAPILRAQMRAIMRED
jgi:hypothetical protein